MTLRPPLYLIPCKVHSYCPLLPRPHPTSDVKKCAKQKGIQCFLPMWWPPFREETTNTLVLVWAEWWSVGRGTCTSSSRRLTLHWKPTHPCHHVSFCIFYSCGNFKCCHVVINRHFEELSGEKRTQEEKLNLSITNTMTRLLLSVFTCCMLWSASHTLKHTPDGCTETSRPRYLHSWRGLWSYLSLLLEGGNERFSAIFSGPHYIPIFLRHGLIYLWV